MITSAVPGVQTVSETFSSVPCNHCHETSVDVVSDTCRSGKPLRTVLCRNCGLVWTDPRPTSAEIRKFYAEDYRLSYKSTYQPKLKHAYRETLRALQRIRDLSPVLKPEQRLLDVGCGGGFFLYALQHYEVQAFGIEPNVGFAKYAARELGVRVDNIFFQDADIADDSFDIVTINHVLEHLEDPLGTLQQFYRWIRPEGHLVVEVPNVEATYHAPANRFHIGHLFNFNQQTLEGIGCQAGFTIAHSTLVTSSRHLHVIFQKPATRLPPTRLTADPENYLRVRRILREHTPLAHYTAPSTYLRSVHKPWIRFREWQQTRTARNGRSVADQLIHAALADHHKRFHFNPVLAGLEYQSS